MDIAGAKALKERLGSNGTGDTSPAPAAGIGIRLCGSRSRAPADVPADAPPVYHWVGVSNVPARAPSVEADDEPAAGSASLFRRLGLSSL